MDPPSLQSKPLVIMPRNDEASKKALEKTLNRVKGIQGHLDAAPRRQRLQGKVAIVTGANSLTGIGSVHCSNCRDLLMTDNSRS